MRLTTKLLVLPLASLFAVASVQANQPPVAQQSAQAQSQQKVMEIQTKLANVQEQVIEENTELKKQQDELQKSFNDVAAEAGFPKEKEEKFVALQQKLQQADPASEEAKKMQQQLIQYQKEFIQARTAIMNDPELQKKQQDYQSSLIAAMTEKEPKVQVWIQELNSMRGGAQ
ncbi:hypothetical protein [Kangiella sp.]|uniref:hypothetical protein n=1 Tax=Kangiella sp. TaxID=1920245 RepID=UPI003A8E5167